MTVVTSQQAQMTFADLLARVAGGEEVLITEGDRPVALLSAPRRAADQPAPAPDGLQPTPIPEQGDDEERPWRGIFVWERNRTCDTGVALNLPPELLPSRPRPFDILWDRADRDDD